MRIRATGREGRVHRRTVADARERPFDLDPLGLGERATRRFAQRRGGAETATDAIVVTAQ